jgi:hypothetical protein
MREERVKKAYFEYWRLQNNSEYISFYKKVMESVDKGKFHQTLDELTDDEAEKYRIGGSSGFT